jgi:hypothetical protein
VRFITTKDGEVGIFYFRYAASLSGYLGLGRELAQNLMDALGLPMLVAALAGLAHWTLRGRYLLLWIAPAVGILAFVILPVRFVQLRFVIITAYMLAFPAADVLARGLQHKGARQRLAWLAVAGVVGFSGIRGIDLSYQMLRDSRYLAADWLRIVARPGDRVGHIMPAANLPYLPKDVRTVQLRPDAILPLPAANRPEFFISIPLRDNEPVKERAMPEETFQRLLDGTIGYRQVALLQGPTLFRHRPATYLNPPVRIFIREDLWPIRIADRQTRQP